MILCTRRGRGRAAVLAAVLAIVLAGGVGAPARAAPPGDLWWVDEVAVDGGAAGSGSAVATGLRDAARIHFMGHRAARIRARLTGPGLVDVAIVDEATGKTVAERRRLAFATEGDIAIAVQTAALDWMGRLDCAGACTVPAAGDLPVATARAARPAAPSKETDAPTPTAPATATAVSAAAEARGPDPAGAAPDVAAGAGPEAGERGGGPRRLWSRIVRAIVPGRQADVPPAAPGEAAAEAPARDAVPAGAVSDAAPRAGAESDARAGRPRRLWSRIVRAIVPGRQADGSPGARGEAAAQGPARDAGPAGTGAGAGAVGPDPWLGVPAAATLPRAEPADTGDAGQVAAGVPASAPAAEAVPQGPTLANARWVGFAPAVYTGGDTRPGVWISGPFDREERTGWITDTATGATARVTFLWREAGSGGRTALLSSAAARALGLAAGDVANIAAYLPR